METRDIPKTIMYSVDNKNSYFGGRNLYDVVRENEDKSASFVFSEGSSASTKKTIKHAVIGDGWKLIRNLKSDTFELYDLTSDPGEKDNLMYSDDPDTELMRDKLASGLSEFKKERQTELEKVEFTKEEIDELKALGYMQ